jgi:hypothetical protein
MKTATTQLMHASEEVINTHDQYEVSDVLFLMLVLYLLTPVQVFNDPRAVSCPP